MALGTAALIGSALGGLGGLLGGKGQNQDPGNVFASGGGPQADLARSMAGAGSGITTQGLSQADATQSVQSNPMLSQMFGQGGALSRTLGKEQDQSNQQFQLNPEDHTMFGQISGDIARQSGQSEKSLAQSLASRGMDTSNVGQAAFSGLQGNKNEMLAKSQMDIMQQRAQKNQEALNSTRQFAAQLGQQAQGAIGQSMEGANMQNQALAQKSQLGQSYLSGMQGAAGQQANIKSNTAYNPLQQGLLGAAGGALAGMNLGSALGGGGGGGSSSAPSGQPSQQDWYNYATKK